MTRAAPEVVRDPRPGTLKATGQPLDIALAGPGYFEVATAEGPAYTRRGDFHLDARGRLMSAQGHAVIGEGGEIELPGADVTVDRTGAVRRDDRLLARLRIVRFEDAAHLVSLGEGLFAAGPGARAVPDAQADVRQGFIENANVDSTHEMVQLMQAMRHFESMHRVAQGYDDMLGMAIRRLGDL
jgi:flagellar basal-body rod protein FlgG